MMLIKVSGWEFLYLIMLGKNWGDSLEAITSPPCLTVYKYDRSLISVSEVKDMMYFQQVI